MADPLNSDLYAPDAGQEPMLSAKGVSILKAAPLTRLSLRCREGDVGAAGKGFGTAVPTKPLTATTSATRIAFWMGPDEWTLIAPDNALTEVWTAIETALAGQPHALVDISDRQGALIITGAKAAWLLNSGVPIDLHESAFAVGTVTRTLFHKVPIMLWRTGPDTFVVEAWGSFMDYVIGLLVQAAGELKAA